MNRNTKSKLSLKRETVLRLDAVSLERAAGGLRAFSEPNCPESFTDANGVCCCKLTYGFGGVCV